MDTKQTKKTRGLHIKPFWRHLGSKFAKIDQNRPKFMDDPKFFEKFFLFKKFLNGPIRKVIIVKVKFEDLRNFFLLPGQPGSTLRKFLVKVKFEDLRFFFNSR